MKKISIFSFLVLLSYSVLAQKALEIKRANKLYSTMQYGSAIPYYEAVLEKDTTNIEIKIKLADCYKQINDSKNAERVYSGLAKSTTNSPELFLRYAQALAQNGKHNESRFWYEKYEMVNSKDLRGNRNVETLVAIKKLYKDSINYSIQSLSINSLQADFSPMYYKNGLVFCSGRRQGIGMKKVFTWNQSAFLDLYSIADTSRLVKHDYQTLSGIDEYKTIVYDKDSKDNKHHTPSHADETYPTSNDNRTVGYYNNTFGITSNNKKSKTAHPISNFSTKINSSYHEGPVCFYRNNDSILFTRNNFYKSSYKKGKDGTNRLKIYSASYIEGRWTDIKNFPWNNDEYSVGHPALTPSNKTVYFVSDMPGGIGGSDIWFCKMENGKWSTPINVGAEINTAGQELFPYVDSEGNLYFSSDGLGGLGGLDIFKATKSNEVFKKPVNVGFPLNSQKDDFGIITDGKLSSGYFSSNRKSGGYDDDIYSFRYKGASSILLEGIVLDKSTNKTLDSTKVIIYRMGNPSDSMVTVMNGLFTSIDVFPDENYVVKAYRNKYLPDSAVFSTLGMLRGDTIRTKLVLARKEIFICVIGKVISEEDKQPMLGIKVKLYNKCNGTNEEVITSSEGGYKLCMSQNTCYTLSIEKENCGGVAHLVSTKGLQEDKTFIHDFELLCKGDIVKLDNIYYDLGKDNIRGDAEKELVKIIPMMNKFSGMKIELRSHTDCRASDEYNRALSDRRAKTAAAFIVSKGIVSARIVGKGYGESLLLNQCDDGVMCTEEEHQINRRTEFKILSMGAGNARVSLEEPDTCQCCIKKPVMVGPSVIQTGKLLIQLKGKTYYEMSKKEAKGITILLTNNTDRSYNELTSDLEGNYLFELKPMASYTITASKEGCATYIKDISTEGIISSTAIIEDISFLCEGDIIKIDNVYYDVNKFDIRVDAAKELDKLLAIFRTYPDIKVELRSHTDCRASAQYNLALSDKRAKSAASYLISKGAMEAQVVGKGYGEKELVNDCACEGVLISRVCSEQEHQVNRRTEIKILSVK